MTPTSSRPKLFVLDAMALIYRAHFVFVNNPRVTSTGLNTSAAFGFVNSLLEVLDKEKPTHIAVAFESEKPTFRHEQFPAYKAQREAAPEELIKAIPMVLKLMKAMNIAVLQHEGFEADDIMGTLARRAADAGYEVYLMTMDKDMAQLVTDHVYLYRPGMGGKPHEVLDRERVIERYGVPPERIADFLGLKGDASDNIPGIPKVGDKTALELLNQFGTLEQVIARAEEITKKAVKASVIEFAEQGRFSKELATIHCEVPVEFAFESLRVRAPDREALEPVLAEYEFRTLARRLLGPAQQAPSEGQHTLAFGGGAEAATAATGAAPAALSAGPEAPSSPMKTIADVPHTYVLANTPALRRQALETMMTAPEFCFDTETTGLDPLEAELVGLALSAKPHEAFYVPVANEAEARDVLAAFAPLFATDKRKVAQNAKYDLAILAGYGIEVRGPLFDTMIAHHLVRAEGKHNMDALARELLGYEPVALESLIGKKGKGQKAIRDIPVPDLADYSAEDADVTLQLGRVLDPLLDQHTVRGSFESIEMPLVPVLMAMEREGVRIDVRFLGEYSRQLADELDTREQNIYKIAGEEFNINSPRQLGEILFDRLKLRDKPKRTATGQYSTDEETLEELAADHPLPAEIVAFRQLSKLKNTYVDTLPSLVNARTGRVHTSYNQAVAITGRLSSNNPNLQNIPIRTEQGREVRKAFVPRDDDHVLLSADYSQIELRLMAHFSEDANLIGAFERGEDIHAATAARIFGVSLSEVTSDMRRTAKTANFGIIYGITAFGLAQRLAIPRGEAKSIIDTYFEQYPGVKRYMESCVESARKSGFVTTLGGRRHYLPRINDRNPTVRGFAERNAINSPLQGSAADLIKLAMIRLHRELREHKFAAQMILQVHDELVFDVPKTEVDRLRPVVETAMREAMSLRVPIEVGLGSGANWLDAH
jgi:DNA polymerase I